MVTLTVVRVFVGPDQTGGNPLGVFLDGPAVVADRRQAIAHELGFSETVFVDDAAYGQVQILTPKVELSFAGHPLVGTAWLLAQRGTPVDVLRPPAGDVPTWHDDDGAVWIRGKPEWTPPMALRQLDTTADVEALTGTIDGLPMVDAWAWQDEPAGVVRSRVFAPVLGVPEDEATGAAAVQLVTRLGRPIRIRQGRGSVILARPGAGGTGEIGGHCVLEGTRDYAL